MNHLDLAFDEQLDSAFDRKLDELIQQRVNLASDGVTNFKAVTPEAKAKLKGLLKYYAKKPHPFTACVRDNRKRFGPRAENVCAVLKDLIRGTTKWRGKNNPMDKGTAGLSEGELVEMDDETAYLIEQLGEMDLWDLMGLAELDEDGVKLDYPISPAGPPPLGESDHAFLDEMRKHHAKGVAMASKYITGDPHPHASGLASEMLNHSTRHIERANNLKKTGRTYGY